MLSEADLEPFFDAIRREAFRVETLPAYAVPVESDGLRSYLAGAPFQKSETGQQFNEFIRRQVEAGVSWRRIAARSSHPSVLRAGPSAWSRRTASFSARPGTRPLRAPRLRSISHRGSSSA